jgi:hypothetical protein
MYLSALIRLVFLQVLVMANLLLYRILLPGLCVHFHWQPWAKPLEALPFVVPAVAAPFLGYWFSKKGWTMARFAWDLWAVAALCGLIGLASLGIWADGMYYLLPVLGLVWAFVLGSIQVQILAMLPYLQAREQFVFGHAALMGGLVTVVWSGTRLSKYFAEDLPITLWALMGGLWVLAWRIWSGRVKALPERHAIALPQPLAAVETPSPTETTEPLPSVSAAPAMPSYPYPLTVWAWGVLVAWLLFWPLENVLQPNPWQFLSGHKEWLVLGYWLLVFPFSFFGREQPKGVFGFGMLVFLLLAALSWRGVLSLQQQLLGLILAYICTLPYAWPLALGQRPSVYNPWAAAWFWSGLSGGMALLLLLKVLGTS